MHISFYRVGLTEYLDVIAEDRTPSIEAPRRFLTAKKTFKGLQGLLDAAEQAGVNEQGLADLHIFAQHHSRGSRGSSEDLSISQEELRRMGFPPLETAMRVYLVSIVPEQSTVDRILIRAKMQDAPPGTIPEVEEAYFSRGKLNETLALIERKPSDLFDPRLGRDVPKKARFNAEDVDTLFHWAD